MDSSIITALVAVFVGLLITMSEKWMNKSTPADKHKSQRPQPRTKPAVTQQVRRASEPTASIAPRKQATQAPAKVAPEPAAPFNATFNADTEGQRVTTDATPLPRPTAGKRIPPMPGGNLRSAIIWSEILRRKF